jgi:hypothetical protein
MLIALNISVWKWWLFGNSVEHIVKGKEIMNLSGEMEKKLWKRNIQ